jgi:hypothetical protein
MFEHNPTSAMESDDQVEVIKAGTLLGTAELYTIYSLF